MREDREQEEQEQLVLVDFDDLPPPPVARVRTAPAQATPRDRTWGNADEREATYEAELQYIQLFLQENFRVCRHERVVGICGREMCSLLKGALAHVEDVLSYAKSLPMTALDLDHLRIKAEIGRESDGRFVIHSWMYPGAVGAGRTLEEAQADWHHNVANRLLERLAEDALRPDPGPANEDDDITS